MPERWSVGVIGAVGAVAGGVSAAAASLLGGGDAFLGSLAVGIGGGALIAAALFWALRDQSELLGASAPASSPPQPATARPALPAADNLAPLVRGLGDRFGELAQRQLDAIDAVGRVVRGPAPEELRRAERLARRGRRVANSLVILADPDAAAPARGPHSVRALLDAALSDSEHGDRINASSVHEATVRSEHVEDVAHLLAELIDNAVRASENEVLVVGRRNAEGYVLSVVDEGEGMDDAAREEANRALRNPPGLDRQHPSALGLSVVGRLAARHDINVQLLEAATDGVIAKVRLPHRLLEGGADAITSPYERAFDALAAGETLRHEELTAEMAVPELADLEPAGATDAVLDLTEEIDTIPDGTERGDDRAGDAGTGDDWPAALAVGIADADADADADRDVDPDTGVDAELDASGERDDRDPAGDEPAVQVRPRLSGLSRPAGGRRR